MASSVICGCCLILPSGRETYLPLQSVSAQVHIADVLARVTLTQHFANVNRTDRAATARYVFPVPVGGAVCAFEMRTADGKVVVGEVKEAHQAEAEFTQAVSQNKMAGLLAKAAPDVFEVSLGAIPPQQAIKTTITYVTTLADDELLKQVRFSLPTYVGERYGVSPPAIQRSTAKYARFVLSAEIQMASAIEQVVSPSHAVKITMQNSSDSNSRCSVILDPSTAAFLDKDFVLSIRASKIDAPRCVAEALANKHSVALSLTLVPRFGVKQIASQEYIFLIDRSGSMRGSKMDYAKKALLIMLKSLPTNGTAFNIVSFGSSHTSLWPVSQSYSPATLNTAVLHADSMEADMGGTEIGSALDTVLKSRTTAGPTSVFVLTDGEVWNVDILLANLRNSVSAAGDSASGTYLRLFTLGVGHSASTALCSGLARVGNGLCLMTTQNEELAGKCARLLRASRVPPSGNLRNLRVDWGYAGPDPSLEVEAEKPKSQIVKPAEPGAVLNLFDEDHDPLAPSDDTGFPVNLPASPDVQQAPHVIPDFYPGSRFIVSAILSKTTQVPKSVVLRGETPDGQAMELNIAVTAADFQKAWPPLIHTLAAHRIIQELEDGYVDTLGIAGEVDSARSKEIAREAIVRYSTEYQLASKYASFVAVEKDKAEDTGFKDDSDLEVLSESDIGLDEWVDNFGADTPDTSEKPGDQGQGPTERAYRPSHVGYSRAQHAVEQGHMDSQGSFGLPSSPGYGRGALASKSARSTRSLAGSPFPMIGMVAPVQHHTRFAEVTGTENSTAHNTAMQMVGMEGMGMGGRQPRLQAASLGLPVYGGATGMQQMMASVPSRPRPVDFGVTRERERERVQKDADILARASHRSSKGSTLESTFPDDPTTAIARLQSFDGSFQLNDALRKLVFGDKVISGTVVDTAPVSIQSQPQSEQIWATAIAIAYLKTKAADQMDIWAGLWEKAYEYVVQALQGSTVSFDQLVDEAAALL